MTEGALLMVELGLFLILLLKVWRVQRKGEGEETGLFAYRVDKTRPPAVGPGARRRARPPHA